MWIICAYHTGGGYIKHAERLRQSLVDLSILHEITQIESQGDWIQNTQYKPTFLKAALEKHYPKSVIYVDVDAIFCQYPKYFDKLDEVKEANIAVYLLEHSKRRRSHLPDEMLSGTVYLKNTEYTKMIVDEWIVACKNESKIWDQRALAKVLSNKKYHCLPETYCTIFDYMSDVKDPVIKHFQASREERRKLQRGSQPIGPRRVNNHGQICIRRIHK